MVHHMVPLLFLLRLWQLLLMTSWKVLSGPFLHGSMRSVDFNFQDENVFSSILYFKTRTRMFFWYNMVNCNNGKRVVNLLAKISVGNLRNSILQNNNRNDNYNSNNGRWKWVYWQRFLWEIWAIRYRLRKFSQLWRTRWKYMKSPN